ncbi:class I SAM-dependent methyltransferase [Marinobacter sp. VGCF2001]|uniref:class I SAM-dependent methyltransferase n=1 Tax=Marinobacter sp. VGCF2001 TaxID=3417189 RepID=UPI003CEE6501
MTTARFQAPTGELCLARPGGAAGLRAWDAADELLLASVEPYRATGQRVLVVDDQFGALTLGLAGQGIHSVADSAALAGALVVNAALNPGKSEDYFVADWRSPPSGPFDLVLLRIPRQAGYLAWLLRWLNSVLAEDGVLLAGGMIKHLPDRSTDVFADAVVTEQVLPARKKARVVVCRRGAARLESWPEQWRGYRLDALPGPIEALPAVFARDKLDIGTRELLPWVPGAVGQITSSGRVLDLACGNGVLGLTALASGQSVDVHFSDVSSQAIASVEHNLEQSLGRKNAFLWHRDGLAEDMPDFDLILLNPPFHERGVVGDHIALRLFSGAAKHLAPGGRVLVVGNRHLGYHRSLRQYFNRVEQRAASPKFVVFEAWNSTQ